MVEVLLSVTFTHQIKISLSFSEIFPTICKNFNEIIIGGDFNLVMDIKKDKRGGRACTHKNSLKEVKGICETWYVLDIWRVLSQEEERYTWRRKKPDIQCRLDFFLISQSLVSKINTSDIVPGYKKDQSMITMAIVANLNTRGPRLLEVKYILSLRR